MTANDLDIPGLKEILWHKMRNDLMCYIPEVANTDLLMCPTGRFLPFEQFDIEHVIPQQSLNDDPPEVRAVLPRNERSVTILICKKSLLINGKKLYDNGCNSWKGRFYDQFLRKIFNTSAMKKNKFTSRHHVSLPGVIGKCSAALAGIVTGPELESLKMRGIRSKMIPILRETGIDTDLSVWNRGNLGKKG